MRDAGGASRGATRRTGRDDGGETGGRNCRVCGAPGFAESLAATERRFGLGGSFLYLRCRDCGSLRISEIPADLARFYPDGYSGFGAEARPRAGSIAWRGGLRDRHALFGGGGILGGWLDDRFPHPELRSIGAVQGLRTELRILDVGCGRGTLLRALHGHGFRSLMGVDPFAPRDLEIAPGVRVLRRPLHELEGQWDLVMFHHSLEHVPDPAAMLRHGVARLAAGGQVLIRIPIVPNAALERYGDRWVGLDSPRHLFVPLARRHRAHGRAAGLRVANVVHDSTALQFSGSERYCESAADAALGAGCAARTIHAPADRRVGTRGAALKRAGRGRPGRDPARALAHTSMSARGARTPPPRVAECDFAYRVPAT
jgi:SAM-dependent methyltransferase